jgi:hypothetical protein
MVKYTCLRCGYNTIRKSNIRNHYNRDTVCSVILQDISIAECLELLENNVTKRSKGLKEQLKQQQDQIDELLKIVGNTPAAVATSTTINNNTGTINNVVININPTINDYDNTNYDIISEDEWLSCIKNENLDMVKCFEIIHFNKKYPENHNIKIENANSKRIMVLKNKKYIERGRGSGALYHTINDKINLDDKTELPEELQIALDKYSEKYNDNVNNKHETDRLFKLMYNKKDMVDNTYKKIKEEQSQLT